MRTLAVLVFLAVGVLTIPSSLRAVPVHDWSKRFGDASHQATYSVAIDGSGNVIIGGIFLGTVDFGGGPLTSVGDCDVFVAKFDPDGNHIWSKRFGANIDDFCGGVAADGVGNVVVTGSFGGTVDFGGDPLTSVGGRDIFVVKYEADGSHLWSRRFGDDSGQEAYEAAVDASGNIVITGWFHGSVDFGSGPLVSVALYDIFVAKFDADCNPLWSKHFGTVSYNEGRGVATDDEGNVAITGFFYGTVNFGGDPLTSSGDIDIFVAKFDAEGHHLWSYNFGDIYQNFGFSVAMDDQGNVAISGDYTGDLFIATFDSDGTILWSQRFGGIGGAATGFFVASAESGTFVVTGAMQGTIDFGGGPLTGVGDWDVCVAQFGVTGDHRWSQRFGDGPTQTGHAVAANGSGDIVVTGPFMGTVDFGGGPLTNTGDGDIFLVKFMETPLPVRITSFDATTRGATVEITWDVWSDEALESFVLYRRDGAHPQSIVIAEGTFDHTTRSHIDSSVEPGKTYHYELLIRTQDGEGIHSPIASATVPRFESTLAQNFPNPFTPSTTIEYTLGERSSAVLGIYDAAGRLVVRLDEGVHDPGTYRAEWNGRDADGRLVGSGVYFCRLEDAPWTAARKMVLVR